MTPTFGLTEERINSQLAPLAALTYYWQREQLLDPLKEVDIKMKKREFSPQDKLIQVLVSILSGCEQLYMVKTRLKPEVMLAKTFGWSRFADQSNLSRILDKLTPINLQQLRCATNAIWKKNSRAFRHDWRGLLWLDFDLSGLPCSKKAEGGKKGYFSGKKNVTGRQLARVSAIKYHETIWSEIYAGNRHTITCLRPAVEAVESILELTSKNKLKVVWRLDGGSGSDEKICWLLSKGYQLVAKGYSNRRAYALAKKVPRWDQYGESWLGEVEPPSDLGPNVRVLVKRRLHKGQLRHGYYIFTKGRGSKAELMRLYELRGGAEIEQFRNDKSGLALEKRRKQSKNGQLALILLTDLAHNLLSDFHHQALLDSPFSNFGPKRIVRDLLSIPGLLTFRDSQLQRIELWQNHPYAKPMLSCLQRFLLVNRNPDFLR